MNRVMTRWTSAGLAVLTMGMASVVPIAAKASEEGRKNTALGLGAVAAYLLLTQKNKLPGIATAAGAAYAYKRYDDSVKDRHKREAYYRDLNRQYSVNSYQPTSHYHRSNRSYNDDRYYGRHDNGLHKGWTQGKHKGWDKNQ